MREFQNLEDFKEQCGYTIDDIWYPRVTKIVSIKAKPALYRYYAEAANFAAAEASTNQSAEEGTWIHEAAEAILLGEDPRVPDTIAPSIEAFKNFLGKKQIAVSPERVERRIISRDHRYAGTVDAIAMIGGKLGVLDIKTSKSVYRDYNLQTSAYMEALKDEFPLETRWILRLDQYETCLRCSASRRTKGGREKVNKRGFFLCSEALGHNWGEMEGVAELKEFPSWHDDFLAFLGAKKLWEWEHESFLRRAGYL